MGWEQGIGIDFAIAFVLKVIENIDVELGVFLVGEQGQVGDGSHQYMIDAGGGFYSCFSCHGILNENETRCYDNSCAYDLLRNESENVKMRCIFNV